MRQLPKAVLAGLALTLAVLGCGGDSSSGPSGPYTLSVINDTDHTFVTVNVSLSSSADPGPDLLGDSLLEPGGTFTYTIDAKETYDIMAVDTDLNPFGQFGVKIKSDHAWHIGLDDCLTCD